GGPRCTAPRRTAGPAPPPTGPAPAPRAPPGCSAPRWPRPDGRCPRARASAIRTAPAHRRPRPRACGAARPSARRVALNRAGHAPWSAPSAAQLATRDLDHLHALRTEEPVGDGVALVGQDQAGPERQQVAAVVPLLARGGPRILVGREHP